MAIMEEDDDDQLRARIAEAEKGKARQAPDGNLGSTEDSKDAAAWAGGAAKASQRSNGADSIITSTADNKNITLKA